MRRIERRVWVGIAGALFLACAPSPPELCKRSVALVCDRSFECFSATALRADEASLGTSASDCKRMREASQSCVEKRAENDLCAEGQTYHLDRAAACSEAVKALSCAEFNAQSADPGKAPPACAEICT
jgi:hypothetical protein